MLRIDQVEFVISAGAPAEWPAGPRRDVALSGRSNVGKSSLLNSLLGRRNLARVSATPGKTQRLNYFLVNARFFVVDLPGYGFARAPAAVQDAWRGMMQEYLRSREQLGAVVQLVDARHAPSRDDHEMVEWLLEARLRFCLVPTKMDKLRQGERKPAIRRILDALELPDDQAVVPYSSVTGEGRDALLSWIEGTLDGLQQAG